MTAFACKKETNVFFPNGTPVTLKSNTTTVSASPADSLNTVLALSWSNPKYATDSASQKFIIEMDSSGRNFSHEVTFTVSGALSDSFSAKQINTMLLGWGFAFGVAYPVDIRITSSYANNNEQYMSNIVTVQMTPYKIPPKVPVPANLYIVGDAVNTLPGTGWSNPVDTPYQKFTQIDSVTFGGIFNLTAGNSYLLLPLNGDWTHKYGGATDGTAVGGGTLLVDSDVPNSNTPAPMTSGWYEITVNFQTGIYTVTPYTGPALPVTFGSTGTGLWIIGDATPESPAWTNDPVSLAGQQFTQVSNADFQITIALNNTGSFLFLPVAGSWSNKYACNSTSTQPPYGGSFGLNLSSNFPGPTVSGNYLVDVDFVTGIYTLKPQ